jgi:release factor glutamine methyltransferase
VSARIWSIRDVLDWAAKDFSARGIDSPRLDAELLVANALGMDRIGLYLDLNRPLDEEERRSIRLLLTRRRAREPVAYILGHRDFYGRRFEVTPDVLIPRPDTETLVEHALEQIPLDASCRVVDVGTGSGAIAVTLAAERPMATIIGTDISEAALKVAARNAGTHGVSERVELELVDLFGPDETYDLVVSNPPYIASADMETLQAEVRLHEPSSALEAGEDGLDVIRELLDRAKAVTLADAHLMFEVGQGQAAAVVDLAARLGGWRCEAVYPDLNRIERVVHLRRI